MQKNRKTKAVTGGKKRFLHKLDLKKKIFLGSAMSLLVLSVGFSGWKYWEYKQLNAKAGGWTTIYSTYNGGPISVRACKTGSYGNYRVKYQMFNGSYSTRKMNYSYKASNGVWYGGSYYVGTNRAAYHTTNTSTIAARGGYGSVVGSIYSVGSLNWC